MGKPSLSLLTDSESELWLIYQRDQLKLNSLITSNIGLNQRFVSSIGNIEKAM